MGLGGLLRDSRSGATTSIVGVGITRSSATTRVSGFLARASGSDGVSLRMYVLPSATLGMVSTSAIATIYQPIDNRAVVRAGLSPVTVSVRVIPRAKLGAAAAVDVAEGRMARASAGPYAQVRIPGGLASVEWLKWHGHTEASLRWGFSATY